MRRLLIVLVLVVAGLGAVLAAAPDGDEESATDPDGPADAVWPASSGVDPGGRHAPSASAIATKTRLRRIAAFRPGTLARGA